MAAAARAPVTVGGEGPAAAPEATTAPAPASGNAGEPSAPVVLDVRDAHTYFYTYDGVVRALDGVSFKLRRGETLGLVGETGCGKSVTAFTITRLVAEPPGRIVSGKILFRGANLLWGVEREATYRPVPGTKRILVRRRFRRIKRNLERMSAIRGGGIAMIFQEPSQAMNPVFSVSNQVGEVLYLHRGIEIVDGILSADARARRLKPALERALAGAAGAEAEEVAATLRGFLPGTPDASGSLGTPPDPANAPPLRVERDAEGRPRLEAHRQALETIRDAARRDQRATVRDTARSLARAYGLPSLETALVASASTALPAGPAGLRPLWRQLDRVHLPGTSRRYLVRERRRLELVAELRKLHLDELREERLLSGRRRRLGALRRANGLRLTPYHLWGVRRRVERPLREELRWRVVEQLERVQIANPATVAGGYPHELSGGMLQRVMIATTLSIDPQILIADEPTTALDVTIQAQILALMRSLKERAGTAIILITHDLAVIAEVADRVCVMYAGQIVENAPVSELFARPLHPYTQGLLASIPRLDRPEKELASIPGSVPNLIEPPSGCRFHPRCPHAMPVCKERRPPVTQEGERHQVACFLYHGPEVRD